MGVYDELVTKLAKAGDIQGVISLAEWVSENIGRDEVIARKVIEVADQQKSVPPSTLIKLYESAKKLGQTVETDQLATERILASTPEHLRPDDPVSKVNVFPDTVESQLSYARFYSRINKPEQADYHFREALSREDVEIDAFLEYAEHLIDQGRSEEAVQQYLEAIKVSPGDPTVHNN